MPAVGLLLCHPAMLLSGLRQMGSASPPRHCAQLPALSLGSWRQAGGDGNAQTRSCPRTLHKQRICRRDPVAPSHTSVCWEEAGRETSFLFKWPSHACVCRGQVFPALRSQSAVPSTVPWAEPWWHCHHPCSCHAPPALSCPLLPPSVHSRGVPSPVLTAQWPLTQPQ